MLKSYRKNNNTFSFANKTFWADHLTVAQSSEANLPNVLLYVLDFSYPYFMIMNSRKLWRPPEAGW